MASESQRINHDEVPLTGLLAEFRTALREEIRAAAHSASSDAVQLVNGRRIAQVGAAHQYVFNVDNALNLPADTPGDLHVPGRPPMPITIISVEGLAITLSVPEDLGQFVPSARLVSDLTFLMRRLIARIEALADRANPAGERARGAAPVSGRPAEVGPSHFPLNPEQSRAVASSLGRDTTFVHGPPGTGKTQTIGAIVEQLYRHGRSVLLVSHTNTAVDQAFIRIGEALGRGEVSQGRALRVGEPRDPRLDVELRLDTHVDRRSAELAQRRDALQGQRVSAAEEVLQLTRSIDLREWVDEGKSDIDLMCQELGEVHHLESELEATRTEQDALFESAPRWRAAAEAAQRAAACITHLAKINDGIRERAGDLSELQERVSSLKSDLTSAQALLDEAEDIAPLRARARELPGQLMQEQLVAQARTSLAEAQKRADTVRTRLSHAERVYGETSSVGTLTRLWRRLPSPEEQREVVRSIQSEADDAAAAQDQAGYSLSSAEAVLAEVRELGLRLAPHAAVPSAEKQRRIVEQAALRLDHASREVDEAARRLAALRMQSAALADETDEFRRSYSATPEEVLREAESHSERLPALAELVSRTLGECLQRRAELEEVLHARVAAVREWGLLGDVTGAAESMLAGVRDAYEAAVSDVSELDIIELRTQRDQLNSRVRSLDREIAEVEEALQRVAETLIAEARVVGTTLTRAYLRDDIQSRVFDTVILDEASIAPIPALWVAASRAQSNVVIVGDPQQLPPIVISDHCLAQKWLGRELFSLAGVSEETEHAVMLVWQYRMHPDISAIPNALVYSGRLRDDATTMLDGSEFGEWYAGHDAPVLLVDTGPLNAWVTSVPRGDRASRLNFLSATLCVDLAEQLLRTGRPQRAPGDSYRVLIVCPYRPHAKLLQLLIREQGLAEDVVAGTVHNFQGTEADVVVFDLVNDEPHWQVGMFDPARDNATKPILNVALTRSRRRLIVVGDFEYIAKQAKNAFLGSELLPFLEQQGYRRVDAREAVPAGLSARAAAAHATVYAAPAEPLAPHLIVRQEQFYPLLCSDLAAAKRRVVIYSAFMTRDRVTFLEPYLRAATERGVTAFMVTRTLEERHRREVAEYRLLERALTDWGAVVVHKRHMHEKLVFIDGDVLWEGSLNVLSSTGGTQEIMERRTSPALSAEFARTVRLAELLGEYLQGAPTCPVCDFEIVASEGREKPFYWLCTNEACGYTRDMDVPPPVDGLITCSSCGAPVQYGEWGGAPAWRCVENLRHRRRVRAPHLRLPKMRALVPTGELRKLDRQFGLDAWKPASRAVVQRDLFERRRTNQTNS